MMENKSILLPSPIIDAKEDSSLKQFTERYGKLMQQVENFEENAN